eukprot:TRINITY_DN2191_c0_g1_i1.p1 TRINITY_DN2191_c0_g1~~TRINITY_DN2191_c0_g1_i1.p1  ORF type:complete len:259 (-),score=-0.42 TRINITY_DN2191_c0_g1_i1:130-906(-)
MLFLSLPNELQEHVLSFLSFRDTLHLTSICRHTLLRWEEYFNRKLYSLAATVAVDREEIQPSTYENWYEEENNHLCALKSIADRLLFIKTSWPHLEEMLNNGVPLRKLVYDELVEESKTARWKCILWLFLEYIDSKEYKERASLIVQLFTARPPWIEDTIKIKEAQGEIVSIWPNTKRRFDAVNAFLGTLANLRHPIPSGRTAESRLWRLELPQNLRNIGDNLCKQEHLNTMSLLVGEIRTECRTRKMISEFSVWIAK